jgi:hypothetical protein
VSVVRVQTTADILLLYPGGSLRDQIESWSRHHPDRHVRISFERSLPGIRTLLRHVDLTVIGATSDPAWATDAFLQASARRGAGRVIVYTETTHEDLELFIRMHGALFVLGPMLEEQWKEFFDVRLRVRPPLRVVYPPETESSESSPKIYRFRNRFDSRRPDFGLGAS